MRTTRSVPVTGEPVPAWAQRGERWLRYDSVVRQTVVVLGVLVLGLSLVDPPAGTGWQVTAYVLVVVNTLVAAVRLVPAILTDERRLLAVYVVGAVLVGATVMLDRSNATSTFGYFLAGNAGFRLASGRAFGVAAWAAACVTAGLVIGHVQGWTDVPWYIGPLVFLPVLIGIANRSRTQAEDATREAAAAQLQASEAQVQAVEAEARAAASAERARIARDVHDVLAHSLAGINMQLEVVDALLENGDAAEARAAAARAQRQVREGMAEVGRTVHALREDALPLVDTLAAAVSATAPPGTALDVLGERREVPTPQATALARVAQEALTNARKHAPGAPLRVALTFAAGGVALDVVNARPDGPGDLTGEGSGMGLVGMRERVEIVGGRISTGPVTDGDAAGGWSVHAEVPA